MIHLCEDEKVQNEEIHQFELQLKNTQMKKIIESFKQKQD